MILTRHEEFTANLVVFIVFLDVTFGRLVVLEVVRSRVPNSVSLDKSNTLFYLFFAFIFVRDILCLSLNVAAVLVRSSAG